MVRAHDDGISRVGIDEVFQLFRVAGKRVILAHLADRGLTATERWPGEGRSGRSDIAARRRETRVGSADLRVSREEVMMVVMVIVMITGLVLFGRRGKRGGLRRFELGRRGRSTHALRQRSSTQAAELIYVVVGMSTERTV